MACRWGIGYCLVVLDESVRGNLGGVLEKGTGRVEGVLGIFLYWVIVERIALSNWLLRL